ncbi:uncharacterized protein LOC129587156 [Paramacrobiotus metropolitanus]|uniref:uncharacterized protein LOC129587156 n=1 Tax=Paramacrobiotus metropolitanus TaxID=2943436 RepID=UPI002445D3DB|nr:uncharacterized protein LOC129587156 [Paramacrobiotus metropolitanus]
MAQRYPDGAHPLGLTRGEMANQPLGRYQLAALAHHLQLVDGTQYVSGQGRTTGWYPIGEDVRHVVKKMLEGWFEQTVDAPEAQQRYRMRRDQPDRYGPRPTAALASTKKMQNRKEWDLLHGRSMTLVAGLQNQQYGPVEPEGQLSTRSFPCAYHLRPGFRNDSEMAYAFYQEVVRGNFEA